MELAVRPDDLHAAAVALFACASRLEDAAEGFVRAAHRDVLHLGLKAMPAAGRALSATDHALDTLRGDITALSRALDRLANLYPAVDRGAVSRR
jgi:hypothetical protein